MNFLRNHLEALIFCAPAPLTEAEMGAALAEMVGADLPAEDLALALADLVRKYEADEFSFGIYHHGGGYQFLTKPAYAAGVGILLKHKSKKRLSTAALETVAIIAYRQPVTKTEIEQIRGVNCDYAVQKLLEKELIEIRGKADSAGRPLLYGTSPRFMDYFGLQSLRDLPQPKDLAAPANEIGETAD